MATLAGGDHVVLQRYRRREDAEYRLDVMGALRDPAAAVGIAISKVRAFDFDADPAWIIFDALPGVPIPDVDGGLEGPRFPALARAMGEMLAAFRELPIEGVEVNRLWADPTRLAARAAVWAGALHDLDDAEHATLVRELTRVPEQFRAPGGARPRRLLAGQRTDRRHITDRTR